MQKALSNAGMAGRHVCAQFVSVVQARRGLADDLVKELLLLLR